MQLSPSFSSGDGSDGDSDSFFARNSEEIARPRVVIPDSIHNVSCHNDRGDEHQGCQQDEDDGDLDLDLDDG